MLTTITKTLCDTQLTTNPSDDWSPSITQTSDGRIWVVWHSHRTGNADLFYKTYDGMSWSPDTQLTADPNLDGLPSIVQASDGTIWVAWTSNRAGNFDLFYKTSTDNGTSWSTETQLTTDPNDDRRPSIIQSSDGKIWVVWKSHRTGNDDLFYKTSSNNGVSWSTETQLTTNPKDDRHPSLIQSSDGKIWVVWESLRSKDNFDLFYKTSTDNGTSWSTETQLTTDKYVDLWPSIMQAQDGAIWVAWQSDRNMQDDIYYKIYDGTSWSPENQFMWHTSCDIMPSIFKAVNETIWLVWTSDKTGNFDLYYKFVIVNTTVKNVTTYSTTVHKGNLVDIYVEIQNAGTAGVTFDVTAYYNQTAIGIQRKTLVTSSMPRQLIFTWDTKRVPYGYYIISAAASKASGETDLTDNSFTDGTIIVTIPGDVNGDRTVNLLDSAGISSHWYPGPPIGPLGYDPNADINQDGNVDIHDAAKVSYNWLESW